MLPQCPCKDCTKETGRAIGCHSKCEKYIKWKDISESYKRVANIEKKKKSYSIKFNY